MKSNRHTIDASDSAHSNSLHTLVQFFLVGFAIICSHPASHVTADDPSKARRYSNGPLTIADFRGRPPAFRDVRSGGGNVPLTAYTFTEVRYDLRFQSTRGRDRWTAKLVSAEAYALVHPDKSWNTQPQDELLLDHEQGHFDVAQSFALAIQVFLDERFKSQRFPVGSGNSSKAATRDLEDKLRAELQPFLDDHVKAQEEYDRVTHHGRQTAAQSEQRKLQLNRISEYNDKLKALRKSARK